MAFRSAVCLDRFKRGSARVEEQALPLSAAASVLEGWRENGGDVPEVAPPADSVIESKLEAQRLPQPS